MAKRPRISFTVDEEFMEKAKLYAKERGYQFVSNLGRIALTRFINRNPVKSHRKKAKGII